MHDTRRSTICRILLLLTLTVSISRGQDLLQPVPADSSSEDTLQTGILSGFPGDTTAFPDSAAAAARTDSISRDMVLLPWIDIRGILNEQEVRFYQADQFPLSLGQRGRLAVNSWRGLGPGAFEHYFAGHRLDNPVTGAWNYQPLPYYQIGTRLRPPGQPREYLEPFSVRHKRPVTRIIFSQDYVVQLSLVDINFRQRLSRHNYVQLSGGNFVSNGSEGSNFSQFRVNTYRTQLHLRLPSGWTMDGFYWQLRHKFNLTPESGLTRDQIKTVGHYGWAHFSRRIGRDSLIVTPSYRAVEDYYKRQGEAKVRNNRYKVAGIRARFRRSGEQAGLGIESEGRWIQNKSRTIWAKRSETDGRAGAFGDIFGKRIRLSWHAGGRYHSETGWTGAGSGSLSITPGPEQEIGVAAFSDARYVPLLWRTVYQDTIPRYADNHFIYHQGAGLFMRSGFFADRLSVRLEPFITRTVDYPHIDAGRTTWRKTTFENRGVRMLARLTLWKIEIENDVSYNHDYETAFAARLNNITTVGFHLNLFQNALGLTTVMSWHYLGTYRQIKFDRLLYHYAVTDVEDGPFYIGDFRIQARFRDAIVFFLWENLLSQDYEIVRGTIENFQIFRLGVDWTLFE